VSNYLDQLVDFHKRLTATRTTAREMMNRLALPAPLNPTLRRRAANKAGIDSTDPQLKAERTVLNEVRCSRFRTGSLPWILPPTLDPALSCSAWQGDGPVLVSRQRFTLEDAIEFHAFAPLEGLPCVRPMALLSGVPPSYWSAL
jgi:hypothetical protein